MFPLNASPDCTLVSSSRIPLDLSGEDGRISFAEWLLLLGLGASAAVLRAVVDLRLGIPGHSIMIVVLPMALGTATVRRAGSGSVMGISALTAGMMLGPFGLIRGFGPGALASLGATGFAFDAWFRILGRRSCYLPWIAAGASANLFAYLVRAAAKLSGAWPGLGSGAVWGLWVSKATVTYPLCGIAAGLVSAAICFRLGRSSDRTEGRDT